LFKNGEGWTRKSNRRGELNQSTFYACMENHNKNPFLQLMYANKNSIKGKILNISFITEYKIELKIICSHIVMFYALYIIRTAYINNVRDFIL
jgi:hypothetical protein